MKPDRPYPFDLLDGNAFNFNAFDRHITRRLSAMQSQYLDQAACQALLAREDILLYEVYDSPRPEVSGELLYGLSIVHP
jgi:oxalate decarboxylase/phosphoglucose isomerase-like protein (cupin superfamily)